MFRSDIERHELQLKGSLSFFKSNEITPWFIDSGNTCVARDSSKTDNNRGESRSENFLKKSAGKSSGPGDFPFYMLLIAEFISAEEKSLSNLLDRSELSGGILTYFKKSSNSVGLSEASEVYSDYHYIFHHDQHLLLGYHV